MQEAQDKLVKAQQASEECKARLAEAEKELETAKAGNEDKVQKASVITEAMRASSCATVQAVVAEIEKHEREMQQLAGNIKAELEKEEAERQAEQQKDEDDLLDEGDDPMQGDPQAAEAQEAARKRDWEKALPAGIAEDEKAIIAKVWEDASKRRKLVQSVAATPGSEEDEVAPPLSG